ncbi:hypothetical protein [Acrocarpospora sp. B8E8]|uniref:hypothetical protein n=1 Tax=Acrocarpospora sp. B8E8 TaxID=3153572 RepID=UPI00325F6396
MCKQVDRPCGCSVRVNDYGDGYQTVAGFTTWCQEAKGLISQLAAVRGRRRSAADIADAITAHVLFV